MLCGRERDPDLEGRKGWCLSSDKNRFLTKFERAIFPLSALSSSKEKQNFGGCLLKEAKELEIWEKSYSMREGTEEQRGYRKEEELSQHTKYQMKE